MNPSSAPDRSGAGPRPPQEGSWGGELSGRANEGHPSWSAFGAEGSRSGTRASWPDGADSVTLAACRLVAGELGMELAADAGAPADGTDELLNRIAAKSRFHIRRISLTGRWWYNNIGPLLGYRTDGHTPVALVWRRGAYRAVDPVSGKSVRVTARTARLYESQAILFYRPLADGAYTNWQLVCHGLRGSASDLRSMVLFSISAVAFGAAVPLGTGFVLGELVPRSDSGLIVQLCVAMLAMAFVSAIFAALAALTLLRVEGRFEYILQAGVWDRLLRLPTAFFHRYSTGELASAALGVEDAQKVVKMGSSTILYATTAACVNWVLLFWFSVPLGLLGSGLLLPAIGVSIFLAARQLRWHEKEVDIGHAINDRAFQILRGLPKLRAAHATERALAQWVESFSRLKEVQGYVGRYQSRAVVFYSTYPPFCTLIVFLLASNPLQGSLSASDFLGFNSAFAIVLGCVAQINNSLTLSMKAAPILHRLRPILAEQPEVSPGSRDPGQLSGDVEVANLTFCYAPDASPVLRNITFSVPAGTMLAVVGASGCGKTTLMRILLGFERDFTGSVRYDGKDIKSLDIGAVRRQFGVVLQETRPFFGTIFQAITGAQNYTLDDAWVAADMAGLSGDIKAMPMGMHTMITDGSTLSGGQRQRISIARALIGRPKVLFFDESTSALDNESQRIVTENAQLVQKTRIVIAHRLSTIMDADQVIVLADGWIAEQGAPKELLARPGGVFGRLVQLQRQDEGSGMD
ncbi:NHLP bacteriocin export ABC transporter permease/ATPase subunit [Streptomyces sp. 6N106]